MTAQFPLRARFLVSQSVMESFSQSWSQTAYGTFAAQVCELCMTSYADEKAFT